MRNLAQKDNDPSRFLSTNYGQFVVSMLLIFSLFVNKICNSQNLVPNGSFELTGMVPCSFINGSAQFANAINDWTLPTEGSSDIHSTLVSPSCVNHHPNSTSSSCFPGSQLPHSGNHFVGFYTLSNAPWLPNYREYIQVQLLTPMVPGVKYVVQFYVSLGDNSQLTSNNIGVKFSNSATHILNTDRLNYAPEVLFENVVSDTQNWVLLRDSIIPSQPYEYIIIGNFQPNDSTISDTINPLGCMSGAYYFCDDVSIFRDASCINSIIDTALCDGTAFTINAAKPGATSYLWQDGSFDSTYTVTVSGTYWVQVNTNNCTTIDTFNVGYVSSPPIIDLGNDTTLCSGMSLTLNASFPEATYLWQNGSTDSTLNTSGPGIYWVTATNRCGGVSDTIDVSYYPNQFLNLGSDTVLCPLETLLLDATNPGSSYLWQDNSGSPTFLVTEAGIYWVQLTDNCGTLSDTIDITYELPLVVNLGNDTALCMEETIELNASTPEGSYLWQDNSSDSLFIVTEEGTYWVQVTLPVCSPISDTIQVSYDPCEVFLVMPNVFSPDGDGDNDLFVPIESKGINRADLLIFNRWGQQIYRSSDVIIGWDGTTASGNEVPAGTYYWIVSYNDKDGKQNTLKGHLTLLR